MNRFTVVILSLWALLAGAVEPLTPNEARQRCFLVLNELGTFRGKRPENMTRYQATRLDQWDGWRRELLRAVLLEKFAGDPTDIYLRMKGYREGFLSAQNTEGMEGEMRALLRWINEWQIRPEIPREVNESSPESTPPTNPDFRVLGESVEVKSTSILSEDWLIRRIGDANRQFRLAAGEGPKPPGVLQVEYFGHEIDLAVLDRAVVRAYGGGHNRNVGEIVIYGNDGRLARWVFDGEQPQRIFPEPTAPGPSGARPLPPQ